MVQLLRPLNSARKRRRNQLLWILFGVAATAAGLWLVKEPLLERYRFRKQERALGQARQFVAARDALSAQLALDVALKAAPGNADTIRVAAEILEQVGGAQAMRLRHAVTQLRPESAEDAARLVLCCLRFQDYNAAKDALSKASPEMSRELPMIQAALAYAIATGDSPVADALLQTLRERQPEDGGLRQTQALIHLRHPSAEKRADAVRVLEQVARAQPERALQIRRDLAGAALERQDYAEARRHIDLLLSDPGATLEDRLQKANIELLVDHRPFAEVYAELTGHVGRDAAGTAQLMRWLLVQNRTAEAGQWLAAQPAELRQDRAVKAVEADMLAQLGDWDRLEPMLVSGVWGAIPAESVRLAMSARVVAARNNHSLRGELWDATLQSSSGSLSALGVLHRLAMLWGWEKEVESTLWTVARAYPDQTWAHQALFNTYKEKRNTAGMRDVLGALRQSNGSMPRYRHDWALLTLLREPVPQWNSAKDTMKELHEAEPSNIVYATGYAFALAQSDRAEEALAVLAPFPVAEREFAPRLPYLAYVNGMARDAGEVARLVALARNSGINYLPEEARLLEQAHEAEVRPLVKPKPRREARNAPQADPAADTTAAPSP